MIGIFLGEQNSGKTLSLSYYALQYHRNGYKIFSNYNLKFSHTKITKEIIEDYVNNKKQFNKAIFCIDEIHILFDARSFPSKANKIFSYFLTQTSKRDVHLLGSTQSFEMIERRFRLNCNFKVFCSRVFKEGKVFKPITKMLRMLKRHDNDKLYIKNSFIIKRIVDISEIHVYKTFYLKAKEMFSVFDTKQLLDM